MTLPSGTRLGPYEISSLLGEGGMGEVYRARDTRLGRSVALKVLPPDLAASPERRRRFEHEARAISALDHPHICVLHDVGHQDGIAFLVMEELEGETLAHRLRKGALPLQQVLGFGVEIAEALYRAHRQGIVHRDVKPSNIMVTRSGTKLLDFGVAKLRAAMDPALTSDPGAPAAGETTVTTDGGIVGTFQYMAPEQLEGNEPDARTDIFALGALLYEMATGRRAFAGENRATLMAAILRSDPVPISILQPLAPPGLDRVVATCLAKDPDDRWQNTRDLASALRLIGETGSQGRGTALVPAPRRDRVAWTIAAIASALLVALALVVAMSRERPAPPLRVHFQIPAPEKTTFSGWTMAVSPDGERIAFAASAEGGNHLYVKPLNAISATRVPGTEGGSWPFWSPDGRQLGFLAEGKLKRIDVSGGAAQVVADFRGSYFAGASWSREGGILYSASGELARVRAGLGKPQPLTGAEWESARFWPQFLPDGRRYLYFSQAVSPGRRGIYVASLDSGERTWILATDDNAEYSPSGHLLFVRGGALMAQAFDAQSLQLSGEAFPVREQVAVSRVWTPRAAFSVAANGVLAWRQGRGSNMQLTWFDRSGRKLGTVGDPAAYSNPTLSPDERRLAVDRVDEQRNTRDLWVFDLARGTRTRLTFDPGEDFVAAWSPDGRRIAFTSDRKGVRDIYQKLSDGSGDDELLLDSRDGPKHVEDWSADGTRLLFNYYRGGVADLFLLPLSSGADRKPIPLVATDSWEDQGQLAPDGRWIAHRSYRANEPPEVYVRGFSADGSSSRGKWQISSAGGREPRWRGDGKELFFLSGSTFMAVDVKTDGSAFEAGVPKPLFEVPQLPEVRRNRYVVTRDGQRFLVNMVLEETIEPIQVLVNWLPSNR